MNGLKNINRAKFLFFFYLVLQALPLFAGMDTSSRARTEIAPRSFNKTELSEYAKQREFQYGEEKKAGLSAWDSFWRWFWNTLGHAISKTASSRLGGGVILLVIVGLLVYIVVSSRGLAIRQVFSGGSVRVNTGAQGEEDIHYIDFEAEIRSAELSGDYRLAVRLLYLRCLKKLSDTGAIFWQPDKTNYMYVRELQQPALRSEFFKLTKRFEYVWYGGTAVDDVTYREIDSGFKIFDSQIIS